MPPTSIEDLVADQWSTKKRAEGKAIMVVGKSGRIHHVDPELATWLGREDMGTNGFDLVPPEMAAEGARTMNENNELANYTVWFPMLDVEGDPKWFRWEGRRVEGLLVNAICLELDPAEHHVHVVPG